MSTRMRALVLFALAAPVLAVTAWRLRRHPHGRPTLPNPPVVWEEGEAQKATLSGQNRAGQLAPILSPGVDSQPEDDFTIEGIAADATGRPVPHVRLFARDLEGAVIAVGRADDEGKFELHGRSSRLVVLYAQAGERRGLVGPIDVDRDRP